MQGVYTEHCIFEILLPTPALSGSGSTGMISAPEGTPANIIYFRFLHFLRSVEMTTVISSEVERSIFQPV